jgi:chemotaxis protein CheD
MVRKLHRVHNDTLFTREKAYRSQLAETKVDGDIELFT